MARDLLRLMLERAGFKIYEAIDGFDALDKVAKIQPDLIILDVMMPEMDGFEVCRTLRQNEQTAQLPVIMLSARTHNDSIREGLEAGANVYLSKLTPRQELIQHIHALLGDSSAAK